MYPYKKYTITTPYRKKGTTWKAGYHTGIDIVGVEKKDMSREVILSLLDKHNNIFKAIPDIMDVSNDSCEQRYRIPNGIRGIICLYYICFQLKSNSLLNPLSSIHYHVDCTDCWGSIESLIQNNTNYQDYILSELDTWLEGDKADNRQIGDWFKLNGLKTIEFRLGEMTFDYDRILKRVIHCNRIVKHFKDILINSEQKIEPRLFQDINVVNIINYRKKISCQNKTVDILTNSMFKLKKELESQLINRTETLKQEPLTDLEKARQEIKNRLNRI